MAIDLCNKLALARAVEDRETWQVEDASSDAVRLDDLLLEQQEILELGYQSTLSHADPRHIVGDPAAWVSDFGYALDRVALRLDTRSSDELCRQALSHPQPMIG